MALTKEMKVEIVDYLLTFSKGLIEDDGLTGTAYSKGEITREDIYEFIDSCRKDLVAGLERHG